MAEAESYPVGTKLVVLPDGVGHGFPGLNLGEVCTVTRTDGRFFDFKIGDQPHTGWGWSMLGKWYALKKKKPTIIIED